jgi:hypothetical protein
MELIIEKGIERVEGVEEGETAVYKYIEGKILF